MCKYDFKPVENEQGGVLYYTAHIFINIFRILFIDCINCKRSEPFRIFANVKFSHAQIYSDRTQLVRLKY